MSTVEVEAVFIKEHPSGKAILIGLENHSLEWIPKYAITDLEVSFEDLIKCTTLHFSLPEEMAEAKGLI